MSLAERRGLRLFTMCILYAAQGIPWGFMATTLPAYLTDRGMDFGFVTATLSFTTLPYTFKWIWGPIIDTVSIRRLGRRRSWILIAQAMMAVTIAVMLVVDPEHDLKLFAWMILIHTTFNALQDVAVDALATELLDDDERGSANGLMYGCKYFGGLLGGIGMASLMRYSSFDTALIVQVVVLLAIMTVPFLVRETEGVSTPPMKARVLGRELAHAFSLRSTLVCALFMLGATFASGVVSATAYKLFLVDLGWDYTEYTSISGGWGLLVGGVTASSVGFLVDKAGRRRVAAIASAMLALGWIVFALVESMWADKWIVYATGLYAEACTATMLVALFALCMDLTSPALGGAQFAGYMALSNFSTTLGYQFANTANEWWTYQGIYLVAAAWQLGLLGLLPLIDRNETRTKLPFPPGTKISWYGPAALLAILAFLIAMTMWVTVQRLK